MNKDNDFFPLSSTQKDIYIDQLLHEDSSLYNIGLRVYLGNVDPDRVAASHKKVVESNDAFGLRIKQVDGNAVQYISADRSYDLPLIDLSKEVCPSEAAKAWVDNLHATPMVYVDASLSKAYLLRLEEGNYCYVSFSHHLAMDGQGLFNWMSQLADCYEDLDKDVEQPLSFKAFVDSDKKYSASDRYQKDKAYWLDYCTQWSPSPLERNGSRGEIKASSGIKENSPENVGHTFSVSRSEFDAFEHLAATLEVGTSNLLLALLASYLGKVSGQDSVSIGVSSHNRKTYAEKKSISVSSGISPLIVKLAPEKNLGSIAEDIARQQKKNFRHQRFPLSEICKYFTMSDNDQRLCDVAFNYQKSPYGDLSFDGFNAKSELASLHHAASLVFAVWDSGKERVDFGLDYDPSALDEETIQCFAKRFESIFKSAEDIASLTYRDFSIISSEERSRLARFSCGEEKRLDSHTIEAILERTVAAHPDKIALHYRDEHGDEYGKKSLSFAELNARANQLAVFVHEHCPESSNVGLLLPRGTDAMVSIVAALKAGVPYIPIDAANPNSRIQELLVDGNISVLLSHSSLATRFGDFEGRIVCFDKPEFLTELSHYSRERIAKKQEIRPSSPAYIIYTSGSTGKPNGVINTHGNLINFYQVFAQQMKTLGVGADSPWLWNSSHAFDASLKGVVALAMGLSIVIPSDEDVKEPRALVGLIKDHNIEVFNAPPSLMGFVLTELERNQRGIHLIVSGEDVGLHLWNELLDYSQKHGKKAINAYGPTETTVNATFGLIEQRDNVTIGKPVVNSQVYVLSESLEPVPVGVTGEIYIGGGGLSAGYLNREELTLERFIECPWNTTQRLFKSGDLASFREDGRLTFVGRSDQQIKHRGFRIELGDIETALDHLPNIQKAVVLAEESAAKIVAYLVAKVAMTKEEVKQSLTPLLPDYMLPSEFIFVDQIPRTVAGKIDIKALSFLRKRSIEVLDRIKIKDMAAVGLDAGSSSAQENIETRLAKIWCEVLGVDAVDLDDDFYGVGGHSLLAMKLIADINETFNVNLIIRDLFSYLTLASQISLIEHLQAAPAESDEASSVAEIDDTMEVVI